MLSEAQWPDVRVPQHHSRNTWDLLSSMIFTGDTSPPYFLLQLQMEEHTDSEPQSRDTPQVLKKEKTVRSQNLKIRFPMLCCCPWRSPLSHQAHRDPAPQVLQNDLNERAERKETWPGVRIRQLGLFLVRLEFIKKMSTGLGKKLVFPLVETSGQEEVFPNEPADQLFYFLGHFSYCVIDFVWALQIFFVHWIFKAVFSRSSLMMLTVSWTIAPVALKFL